MSGNSDNELEKDDRTKPKAKLAEAPEREKIELKVSADTLVENHSATAAAEAEQPKELGQNLDPELESKILAAASAADAPAIASLVALEPMKTLEPMKALEALPPLPNVMLGVLTAFISIMAFLIIPSEFASTMFISHPAPLISPIVSAVFFALHMAWFFVSQKQLIKHTVPLLPEAAKGAKSRIALLTLLPISWIALIGYVFSEKLFFGVFPLLQVLPWLMLVSYIYFVSALNHWPKQLKKSCTPEQKKKFPHKIFGALLGGLMTVPYIWYWKRSLVAATVPDAATTYKLQTKVIDRDKMVIRYRPFIAVERWFKHRHKSTSKKDRIVNASIAISINVVLMILFCYFFPTIVADIIRILTPDQRSAGGAGTLGVANIFAISNQTFLYIAGTISTFLTVSAAYFVAKQPTNYEFTPLGFKSFRWFGEKKIEGDLVPWQSLASIELNTKDKKGETSASELQFNLDKGNPVKLNMGAVESVEDREIILDAIERWAPGVSRSAALVQALQPPVDHSYTEMWLQALSAPPQRDRLKPLTEDIVLNDGRYRVKRSLGVGGQGAAYSAHDQASGDTVVLKEFLLPIYVDISIRKDVLESFESEARILKHLNHDQVVKLKDFFVEDHRAYLVLEHIDGRSLREVVAKEGPLSEESVRELTRQMCTILDYLHSQEPQVVHRDFTPENLILRKDGVLKLIDFNVARQVESNATGSVVGKPAYLPPEQFRGQPVSQSDIYGMGATLAFLLTGKEPEPISVSHPRALNPKVSQPMDKIVAKATAINLKDRYANCSQIIEDLDILPSDNDGSSNNDDSSSNNNGSNGHAEPTEASETKATEENGANLDTLQQLEKDPQKVSFANPAPFKLKETDPDKISLRVSDSANLVGSGQLAITEENEPQFAAAASNKNPTTNNNSLSKASENQSNSGSSSNHGQATSQQLATQSKNNSMFSSIGAFFAIVGSFVSWLTITLAIAWILIPGSPSWFDSKASLHQHEHAAIIATSKGDNDTMRAECDQCIAIDPNYAIAYFGRAYSNTHRTDKRGHAIADDYELILKDLKKAAELDPDDYTYLATYGQTLQLAGRYSEAETELKKSQSATHSALVPALVETIFNPRRISE
ncbi:hypothetical protein BH11CYA1_BH11CYA1_12940 [soil metagenome]